MDSCDQEGDIWFARVQYEILLKEWDRCGSSIARLDTIVFIIRGWAVALATAVVAYSYVNRDYTACYLSVFPLLLLCWTDTIFKSFQRIFILRDRVIERYLASSTLQSDLRSGRLSIEVPATVKEFGTGTKRARAMTVIQAALLRNVVLSYVPLILLVLLVALLLPQLPPGSPGR
jgi:hypothetical protein